MTNPFEFLSDITPYSEDKTSVARLDRRHRLLIDPFLPWIRGGRVLDLACHDGRWSYAMAAAGADEVLGVEARQELIVGFENFPDADIKSRVKLRCDDLFIALEDLVSRGEEFNVVTVFGIFYHIMDHFRLLSLIRRLKPKIIVIDSEFILVDNAIIQVLTEETANPLNATSDHEGQERAAVGVPSNRAVEIMADTLGLEASWLKPGLILDEDRAGMMDYFRNGRKQRGVCVLTEKPKG